MMTRTLRVLPAAEATSQPIPQYISLNYVDIFKIQQVRNAFPLRPVSFSALSSYLECPGCTIGNLRKKRPKEPKQFTHVHQGTLFGTGKPDPRMMGTLLHAVINLLHDSRSPLTSTQQEVLLTSSSSLTNFLRHHLVETLQAAGKLKLAMFADEMSGYQQTLYTDFIVPLQRYQQELVKSHATVFAASERFQFKLLSTQQTFCEHRDWGGYVGIVGEFDQIRLRHSGERSSPEGRPAIFEFKAGLGKKKVWDKLAATLEESSSKSEAEELKQPGMAHAFQLMVYWLAFQTRWDIQEYVKMTRGRSEEVPMPLHQQLDLILYNLQDGNQYMLQLSDQQEALRALINCIFHLDWAMKSGYIRHMPDHTCKMTQLLKQPLQRPIQVGYQTISAEECYQLAREAFKRLKAMVTWHKIER